ANACTFCGAYADKPFAVMPPETVRADIACHARRWPETRRVFLLDGDALAVSNPRLLPVLTALREAFPRLSRVASYATGNNLAERSDAELQALAAHGLSLVYLGLESGCQDILTACRKRATVAAMTAGVQRAAAAGIRSSVIVLLGLGGAARSADHVAGTITALNAMQPHYLSFLSLMLIPGTPLAEAARGGAFRELDATGMLREARAILAGLVLRRTVFRCDHASNHLALAGRLPTDRAALLAQLDAALAGKTALRPWFMRGL
ncbi:MAG TPA: radical SAM protein, partial [bacterium]|nr:radical SAM protein [bacterium]